MHRISQFASAFGWVGCGCVCVSVGCALTEVTHWEALETALSIRPLFRAGNRGRKQWPLRTWPRSTRNPLLQLEPYPIPHVPGTPCSAIRASPRRRCTRLPFQVPSGSFPPSISETRIDPCCNPSAPVPLFRTPLCALPFASSPHRWPSDFHVRPAFETFDFFPRQGARHRLKHAGGHSGCDA
jgi:hypothetical protein